MSNTTPATPITAIKSKSVRNQIAQLCAEVRAINDRVTEDTKIKQALMEQVGELLNAQGLTRVDSDEGGWTVARLSRTTRKISGKLLAKLGVKVSVIEQATEETISAYWTVTAKKAGGADEDEE